MLFPLEGLEKNLYFAAERQAARRRQESSVKCGCASTVEGARAADLSAITADIRIRSRGVLYSSTSTVMSTRSLCPAPSTIAVSATDAALGATPTTTVDLCQPTSAVGWSKGRQRRSLLLARLLVLLCSAAPSAPPSRRAPLGDGSRAGSRRCLVVHLPDVSACS